MSTTVAHPRTSTHRSPATPSKVGRIVAGIAASVLVIAPLAALYIKHAIAYEDVPKQGTILLKGASPVVGDASPVTLRRLSAEEIGAYKLTTVFATPGPQGMRPNFEGTQSFRIISTDAQEGIRVAMTYLGSRGFDREGNPVEGAQGPRSPFQDIEIIVTLNSQGGMLPTEAPKDSPPISGEAAMTQLLVASMEPNKFSTSGTVTKGETWKRQLTGSIAGFPGSKYEITQDIRYEGAALFDGKQFARCSVDSFSQISNLMTASDTNFKYTSENMLIQRTVRATGDVYIDAETGRVHHVILEGRLTSENRQRIRMKDRPEPVDQQPNKNSFPFRNEFHVEYL